MNNTEALARAEMDEAACNLVTTWMMCVIPMFDDVRNPDWNPAKARKIHLANREVFDAICSVDDMEVYGERGMMS